MTINIELPSTLNAEVETEPSPNGSWPERRYFIVLRFGYYLVGRWEWQPDQPCRWKPDDDEVDAFVANKLAEWLFPGEGT